MRRQRALPVLLVLACLFMAGTVLRNYRAQASPFPSAQAADLPTGSQSDPSARWTPALPAERKAATASIVSQLQAFRSNNYQKAVFYQSTGLKSNFSDLSRFRTMIQQSYPEFAAYKSVRFGQVLAIQKGRYVQVAATLLGQDGVTVHAVYMMVRENNIYRVEGVMGGRPATPDLPPGTGSEV